MMKNRRNRLILILLAVFIAAIILPVAGQGKKKSPKDLPEQYRRWIQEEVVYIISPKERDVFLQLENDRERETFIRAFWRQRDETPDTEKNEFREEHYRRISYANNWFGRDTATQGWRTDQGRIYIMLGEPKEIQRFENIPEIRPTIIWFFDSMSDRGLPSAFNIVFFKQEGHIEYSLYSPIKNGPQNLLMNYTGDSTDYESAYYKLIDIEPSVASVSMTLIPGDSSYSGAPSVATDILLSQSLPAAPYRKVKDDYAEKLLRFKDIIEVDYTANYIGNESMLSVFRDAAGQSFVHIALEPNRLNFQTLERGYHTEMEVEVRVSDAANPARTVYQFNRDVPLDVNDAQLAAIRTKLFSYQDLFPLIPGKYRLSLLWKNRVSREFTSVEATVVVPREEEFALNAPVLANKAAKTTRYQGSAKAFLLNGIQLVPSPRNDFQQSDTLSIFCQMVNAPADVRSGGTVEYAILRDDQPFKSIVRNIAEYQDGTNLFEEVPLADFPPAQFRLRITVRDAARRSRLTSQADFFITPMISLTRPFVLSRPHAASNDPESLHILGSQYLAMDDPAKARPLLAAAQKGDPNEARYALDYAALLLRDKDYAGVQATSAPFLADDRKWDFLQTVAKAHQGAGELERAIVRYKEYLAHFGTNIEVLNAIGECYFNLGNIPEALVAWERSIQINGNQPQLKEKVAALKNKK
jgi:GWxTD domain-containing protein